MAIPFPLLFVEERPTRSAGESPRFDAVAALAELFGGFRPSGRRDKVLILTTEEDPAADRVVRELITRAVPVRRFNVETLNRSSSLSLELDSGGRQGGTLMLPTGPVPLEEVKSVWFRRRPGQMLEPEGLVGMVETFVHRESEAAMLGLIPLLGDAFWVNSLAALRASSSKLGQLQAAARLGLRIPHTLVTNEEQRARSFVETCPGGAVLKAFHWLFGTSAETARLIYTQRMLPEHGSSLHLVRHVPCFFQEEVPRATELRVTVFGRRVFPVEMNPVAPDAAPVDWRDPRAQVRFRPSALPESVEAACLALLAHWGLAYAAIDMIRRPDGEHVFLELNPQGNWLQVEDATGLPLSAAMADLLAHGESSSS